MKMGAFPGKRTQYIPPGDYLLSDIRFMLSQDPIKNARADFNSGFDDFCDHKWPQGETMIPDNYFTGEMAKFEWTSTLGRRTNWLLDHDGSNKTTDTGYLYFDANTGQQATFATRLFHLDNQLRVFTFTQQ